MRWLFTGGLLGAAAVILAGFASSQPPRKPQKPRESRERSLFWHTDYKMALAEARKGMAGSDLKLPADPLQKNAQDTQRGKPLFVVFRCQP